MTTTSTTAPTVAQINDLTELKPETLYLPTADFLINYPDALIDDEELGERYFVISSTLLNVYTRFSSDDTQKGEISAELISIISDIQTNGAHTAIRATNDDHYDMYTLGNVNIILDTKKHAFFLETDIEKESIKRAINQAEYWSKYCPTDKFPEGVTLITNNRSISLYLEEGNIKKYNLSHLNVTSKNGYRYISADNECYANWLHEKRISEEDFYSFLPDEPKLRKNEYVIFGNSFEPTSSNIGYFNWISKTIEPVIYRNDMLCDPKNTEQGIGFDVVSRAYHSPDVSPYVLITGAMGTGKTHIVATSIISLVPAIRERVLRKETVTELPEFDQVRVKPDGSVSKRPKYEAKNNPCYLQGPKKKKNSDDSTGESETQKGFERVIFVIPDHGMGAKTETLPGDRMDKFAPKIAAIKELLSQTIFCARKKAGLPVTMNWAYKEAEFIVNMIEFVTMGELSSRSPVNALIILDEAQFHTSAQLRLGIGRPGEGSIVIILADPYQITNRFGASGNAIAILERRVVYKAPFFVIRLTRPIRNGPKVLDGIRI